MQRIFLVFTFTVLRAVLAAGEISVDPSEACESRCSECFQCEDKNGGEECANKASEQQRERCWNTLNAICENKCDDCNACHEEFDGINDDPADRCSSAAKKGQCKKLGGCAWNRKNKTCETAPEVDCSTLQKKGKCRKAPNCTWNIEKIVKPNGKKKKVGTCISNKQEAESSECAEGDEDCEEQDEEKSPEAAGCFVKDGLEMSSNALTKWRLLCPTLTQAKCENKDFCEWSSSEEGEGDSEDPCDSRCQQCSACEVQNGLDRCEKFEENGASENKIDLCWEALEEECSAACADCGECYEANEGNGGSDEEFNDEGEE